MNAIETKIREALLSTKSAADELDKSSTKLDPAYVELAVAVACLCRARRLLNEREPV